MSKTETISIRLTPKERADLSRLAKRDDRSAGYVLRRLIAEAAKAAREEPRK